MPQDTSGHTTAPVRDGEAVRLVRRSGRGATPDGELRHSTGCTAQTATMAERR